MVQTYSNNKKIYSVDMMFAFINLFKLPIVNIPVKELLYVLEYKGWGDPEKNLYYSAMDVINNPKKYKNEIIRINKADLNYPIIMDKKYVIDGVHRLTKAYMENKKYIKAYVFDKNIMKHFLLDSKGNWNKVNNMQIYEFIQLFYKKFNKN